MQPAGSKCLQWCLQRTADIIYRSGKGKAQKCRRELLIWICNIDLLNHNVHNFTWYLMPQGKLVLTSRHLAAVLFVKRHNREGERQIRDKVFHFIITFSNVSRLE